LADIEAAEQATVTPVGAVREPSGEGLEELAPVGPKLAHAVDRSFAAARTGGSPRHAELHLDKDSTTCI
jgi:hypothetical protein